MCRCCVGACGVGVYVRVCVCESRCMRVYIGRCVGVCECV